PAMKGHAALPDGEYVEGLGQVALEIVEQDVADAPSGNDAQCGPDEEIVDVLRFQAAHPGQPETVVCDQPAAIPPAEQDADDIGEAVPVDGERSDPDQNGVD